MNYSWTQRLCYKMPLPSLLSASTSPFYFLSLLFFRSRSFFALASYFFLLFSCVFLDSENLIKILPTFAAQEINYTFCRFLFCCFSFFPPYFHPVSSFRFYLLGEGFLVILICNFNKTWQCRSRFLKAPVFPQRTNANTATSWDSFWNPSVFLHLFTFFFLVHYSFLRCFWASFFQNKTPNVVFHLLSTETPHKKNTSPNISLPP